ncbi:hypothetical protein DICPUDRAFT_32729 [Dictyostelium purpureum]|uniref:Vacuolar protein-sorting-associated protein 25 n=1 Tax=Dictyostelium purpureum TaxID=5786 RepID=F0ZJJ2_DICPU|nr:uncharacterized protein DICPUDRAFT_32729 [Dictyostelium purpureum]EGC35872.1 hypothetical protein DICPUDRAFT_32729 [Dictyostelium purpureum]|eukprot:XP_003287603.1 hypothetical protein DICPUDRAFT_32729 [Dictyostelium purpureum]
MNSSESFQFPLYYNKEPFFTIQPIINTRKIQLQMWQDLILAYSRSNKIYELDLNESIKTNLNLFNNEKINRKLSRDSLKIIFDDIIENGYAEWIDKEKNRVLIMWRKPEEWASLIYKWVSDCGFLNTVLTIWEIQNGDDSKKQDFHQLNTTILLKSLKVLEKQSKAQTFSSDDEGNLGVKFFSI